MINHTFETHSGVYWKRVGLLLAGVFFLGLLPLFLPTASDPRGFALMAHVIGLVSLAVLFYVRPKELTLAIDESGVTIAGDSRRVLYSKPLEEIAEVHLGRWGRVLKFPVGWIVVEEIGGKRSRTFGAIAGYRLPDEVSYGVFTALEEIRSGAK